MAEIYGIAETVGGFTYLRYVGKANDTVKRLASHSRDMWRRHSKFYRWLREAMSRPEKPFAVVLASCKDQDWPAAEKELIAQWRAFGEPLLNESAGGNEPPKTLRAILAANGRATARAIHDDPIKKAEWRRRHIVGIARAFFARKAKAIESNDS